MRLLLIFAIFGSAIAKICYRGIYTENLPQETAQLFIADSKDPSMKVLTHPNKEQSRCGEVCSKYEMAAFGRKLAVYSCTACEEYKKKIEAVGGTLAAMAKCMTCTECSRDLCNRPTETTDGNRDDAKCEAALAEVAKNASLTQAETEAWIAYNRNPTNGMDSQSLSKVKCYNSSYFKTADSTANRPPKVECDGKCVKYGSSAYGDINNDLRCVPKNLPFCKIQKTMSKYGNDGCMKCEECDGTCEYDTDGNLRPQECLPMLKDTLKYQGMSEGEIKTKLEEMAEKYNFINTVPTTTVKTKRANHLSSVHLFSLILIILSL